MLFVRMCVFVVRMHISSMFVCVHVCVCVWCKSYHVSHAGHIIKLAVTWALVICQIYMPSACGPQHIYQANPSRPCYNYYICPMCMLMDFFDCWKYDLVCVDSYFVLIFYPCTCVCLYTQICVIDNNMINVFFCCILRTV